PPAVAALAGALAAALAVALPVAVVVAAAAAAPLVDRLGLHEHAPAAAVLARLGEHLEQPLADPLAGHLHQAQRGHLGDLVLGPVPAEALGEPPQHEVA